MQKSVYLGSPHSMAQLPCWANSVRGIRASGPSACTREQTKSHKAHHVAPNSPELYSWDRFMSCARGIVHANFDMHDRERHACALLMALAPVAA